MTAPADRLAAALADRYRIERELGQGGMATVYLAEDLRHQRRVAIKVLKPDLAAVLGAERFVQEITTTASLQHPHILPLFDSGTADGFLFYVMPYIEGETLRDRLNRETQLGIEEAVRITAEVADALDYAHRHGVIHRDIKPENILLHDGRPMVADFGIALAVSAAAGGRMTETGLSLGTPHYMSPEQATAEKDLTARSDIYSLGSVLYEMLTGNPPHVGATAQQIIMKIVTEEAAPVTKVRKSVPANVAAAVAQAIERLPADRFESARAFAEALANPAFTAASEPDAAAPPSRQARAASRAGWGLAAVLAIALAWSLTTRRSVPADPGTRFTLSMGTESSAQLGIAISPDGRRIAQPGPGSVLQIRDLGSLELRVLTGTAGIRPRFSPDGRWIAYTSADRTLKVPVEGGTPIVVGDCDSASWLNPDALLCIAPNWGLGRISSTGGPVEQLTVPDTAGGEIGHWTPEVLPGGRAALFTSYRRPASRIEALDLRTGQRTVVMENAFFARYAPSGHLLFVRDSTLFAVRFDPATFRSEGSPVPVLEDVAGRPSDAEVGMAISANGTLVVVRQSQWRTESRLAWVDRAGRETEAIPGTGTFSQPRLSPNGNSILVTAGRLSRNLWIADQRRGLLTQLTRNPGSAFYGTWSTDGRQVFFTNETPSYDLYRVPVDGSAGPSPVVTNTKDKYPYSVSPDGRSVAYEESWAGQRRVRVAPADGSDPEGGRIVGDSTVEFRAPRFSPDGRWIAVSGRLGTDAVAHVYVLRADGTGGALQISAGEADDRDPHWTRGGRELVYQRGTSMHAVDLDLATGDIGRERKLFEGASLGEDFDVTPDGSRFLMIKVIDRPAAQPLLVITNFFDELRRKVGE